MLILQVTSGVTVCLYVLNIYHFTYTLSHAHTEAHTHKHTCTISTQEEWRQPDIGACLRGAEERLLLQTKALHTHKMEKKKSEKNGYSRIGRKGFEHIELPAKLLDYFLRSNKSNINQSANSPYTSPTAEGDHECPLPSGVLTQTLLQHVDHCIWRENV